MNNRNRFGLKLAICITTLGTFLSYFVVFINPPFAALGSPLILVLAPVFILSNPWTLFFTSLNINIGLGYYLVVGLGFILNIIFLLSLGFISDKATKNKLTAFILIGVYILLAITSSILLEKSGVICSQGTDTEISDSCYYDEAITNSNLSICDNILDLETKGRCYEQIGFNRGQINICDQLINLTAIDSCLNSLGFDTKDNKICPRIKDARKRDNCYSNTATSINDCSLIMSSIKDQCISRISIENNDSTQCSLITTYGYKSNCYEKIASQTKNYNICFDSPNKNGCLWEVALRSKNIEICDKIDKEDIKLKCFNILK